jgi:LacI family transcriptional regulator
MNDEKEVTIYDIARELKLSASTVSRALKGNPIINYKTRQKVAECSEKLGYRSNAFASNLRRKKTNTIGVIVPRLDSHFLSSCLAGMEEVASANGYNLIIAQSHESSKKEAENAVTMFNNRVDGLIVSLTAENNQPDYFRRFTEKHVPIVYFDRIPGKEDVTCVCANNFDAAYKATQHLIEKGCRRLLHITISSASNVYAHRCQGFEAAAKDAGCIASTLFMPALNMETGRDAADQIIKMSPRPEGIFVANDIAAAGCMIQLETHGIAVPDDMLIIGFNNDPICLLVNPPLSTVSYSGRDAGMMAADRLFKMLDNEDFISQKIIIETSVIERESSLIKL